MHCQRCFIALSKWISLCWLLLLCINFLHKHVFLVSTLKQQAICSTTFELFINCLSTFYQLFINFSSIFINFLYQRFINVLSVFINWFINFLSTLSCFINFLSTVYQLLSTFCFINFLSTLLTFYLLFINFLSIFFINNLSTFYQRFINCLSTVYQLFINFFINFFFYQLYQHFINFLSTFNCFSFMSYISALPNIIFALHSLCSIDQSTFASYVSGAPQFRSPPVAANMHLKMILKFVYPHCLMHPPQQPLKGHWISMCNLQSVIFHPSTSWSTSITVIV